MLHNDIMCLAGNSLSSGNNQALPAGESASRSCRPRFRKPWSTLIVFSRPGRMKKKTTRFTFSPVIWLRARA